jgi:hypothetical protein
MANTFPEGHQDRRAAAPAAMTPLPEPVIMPLFRKRRGQAMTETVLMFPLLMFFLFAFAKIYALLILVQKIEIASFYAARRWQLESHRNVQFVQSNDGQLQNDIQSKVSQYLGYDDASGAFLDLSGQHAQLDISRTQVWQVVTLTVKTHPLNMPFYKSSGFTFEVTKYVPNRDRPIPFVLPGLQN